MEPVRERMDWSELGSAARALAAQMLDDGYRPDFVLAIARGGLLVGGALGYALGVKNVFTMNVEFYTGVDERLPMPMILPPVPELVDLDDARVLIADDVADTGRTLALVQDFCAGKVGEVRTAVLYEKPASIVHCDYVWRRTDRWIDFPWSAEAPVGAAV
ncbi:MAG TPA: phosphoribosyltransferase family protein [Gaiellaceae bacterium]